MSRLAKGGSCVLNLRGRRTHGMTRRNRLERGLLVRSNAGEGSFGVGGLSEKEPLKPTGLTALFGARQTMMKDAPLSAIALSQVV